MMLCLKKWLNLADNQQAGLSILEAMLVLLVVAVIILATVAYFRQAEAQAQVTAFLSEMKGVIQAAEDYNAAHNTFAGITVQDIVKAKTIVPRYNIVVKDHSESANRIKTPWAGGAGGSSYPPGILVRTTSKAGLLCMKLDWLKKSVCQPVVEQLNRFVDIKGYDAGALNGATNFCAGLGTSINFSYPKRKDGYPASSQGCDDY